MRWFAGVNRGCLPFEGRSDLIVGFNEPINGLTDLLGRGETGATERLAHQDAEPAFDLVEPGRVRWRVMKVHAGMAVQPAIALGLVRIEVVENDVDLAIRVFRHEVVHEVQELPATTAGIMPGFDLPRGDI